MQSDMQILLIVLAASAVLTLVVLALSPRIVQQDQPRER